MKKDAGYVNHSLIYAHYCLGFVLGAFVGVEEGNLRNSYSRSTVQLTENHSQE